MSEPPLQRRWSISLVLVAVNVAVYVLEMLARLSPTSPLARVFACLPLSAGDIARGWLWQFVTFQFLHAGLLHLCLNCLTLFIFGRLLEALFAPRAFLALYLGCGAIGGLFQTLCCWAVPAHFGSGPLVGASAGVFGLVATFAILNRDTLITSFLAFLPITMPAKYLLAFEAVVALLGMLDPRTQVAHAAHLGGMIAAVVCLKARTWIDLNRLRVPRPRRFRAPPELVGTTALHGPEHRRQSAPAGDPRSTPEFIREEVDPILEKISAHGIHSLTERERRILELARARIEKP